MWVRMTYVPIDVERTQSDSITITVSDSAQEIAEEEAMYGCWVCHTPLDVESFGTSCDPPQNN